MKKRRGCLRLFGKGFLLLIVLDGIVIGVNFAQLAYERRQITGNLTSTLADQSREIGNFTVTWRDSQLSVTHRADPQKILWQSVPDTSFVNAGIGNLQVTESRGAFFFNDDLQTTCANQDVVGLLTSSDAITLTGTIACSNKTVLEYSFAFHVESANQLGVRVTFNDPQFNRAYLTYASTNDEHFFGFGEQFSYFDLKGKRVPIVISEQGIGRGEQPITAGAHLQAKAGGTWAWSYAAVPHYITSQLRSFMLENDEYSVFDLRQPDRVHVQVYGSDIRGRIIYGDSPAALIQEYTTYAGRMRPLPTWITSGAIVGMQGGTQKVRDILAQLQAQNTPIAAFWLQDWVGQRTTTFGKQLWWNWELDQDRYPEWDKLRADLDQQNIKLMTYINPFVTDVQEKANHRRNLFVEARDKGYLIRHADERPYLILNTSFSAGLVDLTNPAARDWLKSVIKDEVIGAGATGWMADFGEALPYDAALFDGTSGADDHNRYPEAWARLNREVIDSLPNGNEYVFFMRAGFTRSPQFATLFWEGDQLVSWSADDGIKSAVTGLVSGGMAGYSLNHSDIGGYTTITSPIRNYHRSKELLMRWMEMNAFTAIFRTHEGNQPDNNVQFYSDADTLAHFAKFAKIYAAFAEYRQTLIAEAAQTGLPVVRHPFIHYPNDPNVYNLSYQQFMLGSEFMVAPVLDHETSEVQVYLPAGRWVHLWSGQVYGNDAGTTVKVAAPLGEPAVFYKENSAQAQAVVTKLKAQGLVK